MTEEPAGHVKVDEPARPREAVLRISHVEPWSVTRVAFVLSCAISIMLVVAVLVCWIVMKVTGVFGLLGDALTGVISDGSQKFTIGSFLGLIRLLFFTVILSIINVFMVSALAAVGARLYNTVADLAGGIQVTFTDD